MLLILWLMIALAACSSTEVTEADPAEPEGISLEEATQIVLDEVISSGTLDHELVALAWHHPLSDNDELISFSPDFYEPASAPIQLPANAWFFWLDDAPGARFAHPSRFVVIDRADGAITLQESEWWPVLNGENLWIESEDYWNEESWIFNNIDWRAPTSLIPAKPMLASVNILDANNSFHQGDAALIKLGQIDTIGDLVVINGGGNSASQNASLATDSQNILGLFGSDLGFGRTYLGPEITTEGDLTTGNNELETIGDVLEQKARDLEPGQTLFIYITGHGFIADDDGRGLAAGISENLLEIWLSDMDPGVNLILVIDACYSGSFVDTTSKFADITITSTSDSDYGYFDLDNAQDPNPEDSGGEYTSGFVEDWQELSTGSAEAEKVRDLSISRGQSIWETLASQSHISATQKDAAFLAGKTFPLLVPGQPQTKATNQVQLDQMTDPSNDTTMCGSDEPLLSNADIIGAWMGVDPSHGTAFVEVEFEHGAPLDDISFATAITVTDMEGNIEKYLWEIHNEIYTIGKVDPDTFELLPPDQQQGSIDVVAGSNVVVNFPFIQPDEITLIPLVSPIIISVDSFNTTEASGGVACDSFLVDPFFTPPASIINDPIAEQFAHITQAQYFPYSTGKLTEPQGEDDSELVDEVLASLAALASGNQVSHSDGQQAKPAAGATDITGINTFYADIEDSAADELFGNTDFPCGPGEFGFTVCGQSSFPAGRAFVIGVTYDDDIVIQDPLNIYQYGFVFDSDGDTTNNYEASESFPNDFFDGTDIFYVLAYTPQTGWELTGTDVRGERRDIATGARAVIRGDSIMMLVPASEIDLEQPSYRLTAFRHTGDFGLNPPNDWDADVVPPVDQPLIQFGEQLIKISFEDGRRELGRLEDLNRIQNFYSSYNQAFADQNTDFLFESLHPAVYDLYGEDACRTYLDGIVANTITVEALSLDRHGAWIYDQDNANILIQNAYTAQITVTLPSASTVSQTTHLGVLPDGTITWFTDCGEPLP